MWYSVNTGLLFMLNGSREPFGLAQYGAKPSVSVNAAGRTPLSENEVLDKLRTIYRRRHKRGSDEVMLQTDSMRFYSTRILGRWYKNLPAEAKEIHGKRMPMLADYLFQCEKRGGHNRRDGRPSYADFRKFQTLWKWFSLRYHNLEGEFKD